jgi:restriction system protein
MSRPKIPQYHELMWPALEATKALGGSATVREMNERAVEIAHVTEAQQAVPHGAEGRMSEVEYRLHWARTHLKGIGALENSARGVWALTDHGRSLTESAMQSETKAWRLTLGEFKR